MGGIRENTSGFVLHSNHGWVSAFISQMVRPTINQLGQDDQLDQVFPFGENPHHAVKAKSSFILLLLEKLLKNSFFFFKTLVTGHYEMLLDNVDTPIQGFHRIDFQHPLCFMYNGQDLQIEKKSLKPLL